MDRLPETVNISQQSLDRLSSALDQIVKQHGSFKDSSDKARDSVKGFGDAAGSASKVGSEFNSVSGDMARAFSALGVQSGEAASRIGALGGALDSLKNAAPELLAIVGSLTAGVTGFELFKAAISDASDLQNSMSRLGQVVKDQGGNWNLLSRAVQDYVDVQVRNTTYSDTQVVNSLERLVASGMSVKDAMTSTRIAEDLAAASGKSLEEATNSLVEATHGRLMGLEAMGVLTKEQVKDGITYDQVLQQIESHMGGSALAATKTYTGALSQLGAEWTKLLTDAGTPFLGLLAKIANGASGVVDKIDHDLKPSFKAISDWANSEIPNIKHQFDEFYQSVVYLGHEFREVAGSDVGGKLHDVLGELHKDLDNVEASLTGGKTGWAGFRDILKQCIDDASKFNDLLGQIDTRLNQDLSEEHTFADTMKGFWRHFFPSGQDIAAEMGYGPLPQPGPAGAAGGDPGVVHIGGQGKWHGPPPNLPPPPPAPPPGQPPSTHTDFNPMLGGPSGKGGAEPPPYTPMELAGPTQLTAVQKAAQSAENAVKALAASEATLKGNMDGAATQTQYLADKQKLYEASITGTEAVIGKLSNAHKVESGALAKLNPEVEAAREKYNNLAEQYNKTDKALSEAPNVSKKQAEALRDIRAEADQAKKKFDELTHQQTDTAHALATTSAELEKQRQALKALQDQPAELSKQFDEFQQKQRADTAESIAIIGMSTSRLYDHYASEYQADYTLWLRYQQQKNVALAGQILPELQAAYQHENQELAKIYQEDYQHKMQFESEATNRIASFLNTIVVDHKGMAAALKSVYDDILKYFMDMVSKMLAEAVMALPWIQALFGGGGPIYTGNPATSSTEVQIGGSGPGSLGPSIRSGLGSIASSPTIAGAMAAALSPSGGGGSVGSGMYADTSPGGGGGGLGYGGYGNPLAGSGASLPSYSPYRGSSQGSVGGGSVLGGLSQMLTNALKGPLGKIALGFGLGDIGATLTGGNPIWGALGGGLGAGLGLLGVFAHANPLVGIGFDLLMGIVGGMFGNHFNAANEPDINNPEWGQANADMQGMTSANPMNANGKQYVMDSQTAQATGGKGWNLLFEKFVQQYRGNVTTLPYTLQSAFPQIEQLWGGATDKQYFNPDGKDGYLDIGSGKRALWSDFWNNVQQYGSDVSQLMQGQSAISMYVTSANSSMHSIGSGTPSPGGNGPFMVKSPDTRSRPDNSNAIASGGPGRLGASLAEQLARAINVDINIRNSSTLIDNTNLASTIKQMVAMPLASALEDYNIR